MISNLNQFIVNGGNSPLVIIIELAIIWVSVDFIFQFLRGTLQLIRRLGRSLQ